MSSQIYSHSTQSVQTLAFEFVIFLQCWKKNGNCFSMILQKRILLDAEPYCSPG